MTLTKQQCFELVLQYGSLADIAPTLELLEEIASHVPYGMLGAAAQYVHDKVDARLGVVRDIEVQLVLGELTYTLEEAEEFICTRLCVLDELLTDYLRGTKP